MEWRFITFWGAKYLAPDERESRSVVQALLHASLLLWVSVCCALPIRWGWSIPDESAVITGWTLFTTQKPRTKKNWNIINVMWKLRLETYIVPANWTPLTNSWITYVHLRRKFSKRFSAITPTQLPSKFSCQLGDTHSTCSWKMNNLYSAIVSALLQHSYIQTHDMDCFDKLLNFIC